jgi:transcriptional regulator with XRE-family HTH domain
VNELLTKARERKRLTRKEMADFLGISLSMVEKVEKGSRRASPDLAKKWGDRLGIKETQLYKYFFAHKADNMCRESADETCATVKPDDAA